MLPQEHGSALSAHALKVLWQHRSISPEMLYVYLSQKTARVTNREWLTTSIQRARHPAQVHNPAILVFAIRRREPQGAVGSTRDD